MADGALSPHLPWVREMGIRPDRDSSDLFDTYLDELCRWNARMNLVGPASRDRIVRELLLDSLVPFPMLPEHGRLLDVGSGAGFPAIPLKICGSKLEFLLVEPIQKRVSFLKQVIRSAGLSGISVSRGRIHDDREPLNPDGYDVVTARAVAPLAGTIRLCGPWVARGGILFTFHGESARKNIDRSGGEIEAGGLVLERVLQYRLPGLSTPRHLAMWRKTGGVDRGE